MGGMGRVGGGWNYIAMVILIEVQLFGDLQCIRQKWGMILHRILGSLNHEDYKILWWVAVSYSTNSIWKSLAEWVVEVARESPSKLTKNNLLTKIYGFVREETTRAHTVTLSAVPLANLSLASEQQQFHDNPWHKWYNVSFHTLGASLLSDCLDHVLTMSWPRLQISILKINYFLNSRKHILTKIHDDFR